MTDRLPITDDDVRAVVRLLGDVAGRTDPLPERRRVLMAGLATMIGADVWLWAHSGGWDVHAPFLIALIDAGWTDDPERNRLLHADTQPEWHKAYVTHLDRKQPTTWLFDATHPGWGDGGVFHRVARPTGFEHLLFSMRPMTGGVFSGIAMHRRGGRPAYTPRETALAHLILNQVDWLHEIDPPPAAAESALGRMTPRAREVLIHLLGGDGRKQIAAKLGISEYTVGDHIKGIYKSVGASSRAELMAKFLPAGR